MLLVGQRLATYITDVHVFARVGLHVEGERVSVCEHFAARGALVDLGRLVAVGVDGFFVGGQIARVGEGLAAHVALKGLLTSMEVFVLQ